MLELSRLQHDQCAGFHVGNVGAVQGGSKFGGFGAGVEDDALRSEAEDGVDYRE